MPELRLRSNLGWALPPRPAASSDWQVWLLMSALIVTALALGYAGGRRS